MQVLQGDLHGMHFQSAEDLSEMVPGGQISKQVPLNIYRLSAQ